MRGHRNSFNNESRAFHRSPYLRHCGQCSSVNPILLIVWNAFSSTFSQRREYGFHTRWQSGLEQTLYFIRPPILAVWTKRVVRFHLSEFDVGVDVGGYFPPDSRVGIVDTLTSLTNSYWPHLDLLQFFSGNGVGGCWCDPSGIRTPWIT